MFCTIKKQEHLKNCTIAEIVYLPLKIVVGPETFSGEALCCRYICLTEKYFDEVGKSGKLSEIVENFEGPLQTS